MGHDGQYNGHDEMGGNGVHGPNGQDNHLKIQNRSNQLKYSKTK